MLTWGGWRDSVISLLDPIWFSGASTLDQADTHTPFLCYGFDGITGATHTNTQTNPHKHTQSQTHTNPHKSTQQPPNIQTHKQSHRNTHNNTNIQTHKQTHTNAHKNTNIQTQTNTHKPTETCTDANLTVSTLCLLSLVLVDPPL